jgi:4-amino-4-deoxy-L-arabinose transferase-like glycosyltransferase
MSNKAIPARGAVGFMSDLRDMLDRYVKRTSPQHKRSILLLVLAGAILRAWMLFQPVTYDEARTYELFISRPWSTILSDHTDPLNHIFHSLLAKVTMMIGGRSLLIMRLPSFLAGVLAMPLFYLFTRAMFNRYIAMLALALVAASAPLVEFGALAQGHSLTWLFMMVALALGRHLAATNNQVTGILLGVALALGMWSMTTMIYPALAVYFWLLFYLAYRYEGSLKARMNVLVLSMLVFLLGTLLLYLPVIMNHGPGHLWDHPSLPERNWNSFRRAHQDGAFDLWVAIADTTGTAVALLGLLALLVAAFISSKYRILMFGLAAGAIPLVLLKARVAPPPVWYYSLFLFHIGTAITLFYALKFIQEKAFTSLGKRTRSWVTSILLFAGLSVAGTRVIKERIPRFPEAVNAGGYLAEVLAPGDRAYVEPPWDAPVRFHAMLGGVSRAQFHGLPGLNGWAFLLVVPSNGQLLEEVIEDNQLVPAHLGSMEHVKDLGRIEIFAARYSTAPAVGAE